MKRVHGFSGRVTVPTQLPLLLLISGVVLLHNHRVFSHGPHPVSPLACGVSIPAGGKGLSRQSLGLESFR